MTVTSLGVRNEYTAIAGQTVFNYTFLIFSTGDLNVYITPSGQTANDSTDITSAYVVDSGTVGNPGGGFITLDVGVSVGDLVTIVSDIVENRTTDYQNSGDFNPIVVNDDFDKSYSLIKQQLDSTSRTLSFPQSLQNAFALTLPLPVAGQYVVWNGGETGLINAGAPGTILNDGLTGTTVQMVANASLSAGDFITTTGYTAQGDGGGNLFLAQAVTGASADGGSLIKGVGNDAIEFVGLFPYGDNAKQFGCVGDGAADDTPEANFYLAFSDNAFFPSTSSFYSFSDRLTVPRVNMTIRGDGFTHFKWASLGSALATATTTSRWTQAPQSDGIRVSNNGFKMSDIKLQGVDVGTPVAANSLVVIAGLTTSTRISGFEITNCEFLDVGGQGIYAVFADDITVRDNSIHNIGWHGSLFFSCNNVHFENNTTHTITPGFSLNMYGVSFTHDSTLYNTDSNVGTPLAEQPFCSTVRCVNNKMYNINWEAIDFHGGYHCTVSGNQLFDIQKGIAVSNSSGDAIAYSGWGNRVVDNLIDASNEDGTTSGREFLDYGINIAGGATLDHEGIVCTGNTIRYSGIANNTNTGSIAAQNVNNAVVGNNTIDQWMGQGIYTSNSPSLIIDGNSFGVRGSAAADTASTTIRDATAGVSKLTITGNTLSVNGGNAPAEGFRGAGLTNRIIISDNDFSEATTQYILPASGFVNGNAFNTVIEAGASDTTPTVSPGRDGASDIILVFNPTGGNVTVTDLDDPRIYQRVTLYNIHPSNTITFTRDNARLDGGANAVLNQYDTLVVFWDGARWIEETRSANS